MTGTALITSFRARYGDVIAPYRFSDLMLIDWINQAKGKLFRVRPDLASVTTVVTSEPADIATAATDVAVHDMATDFLVESLMARAFENAGNPEVAKLHDTLAERALAL